MVAHHDPQSARPGLGAHDLDLLADQAVLDAAHAADRRLLEDDRILDLGVLEDAGVVDRRERPDVGIGDPAVPADYRIVVIELPESLVIESIDLKGLPDGWPAGDSELETAAYGTEWASSSTTISFGIRH